jgi:hypothetical protein
MKRKILSILAVISIGVIAVGCGKGETTSTQQEQDVTEANQQRLIAMYPVPQLDTSLERDIVVQLYQLRNKARNTHSVITSDGTGKPIYDCPSVGYPIANDVQLTNPDKLAYASSYGTAVLPQAEPNGLYSADSSWGTWVLCTQDDGTLAPIYNEMDTVTFPFPVTVDYVTGEIKQAGASTMAVKLTDAENR